MRTRFLLILFIMGLVVILASSVVADTPKPPDGIKAAIKTVPLGPTGDQAFAQSSHHEQSTVTGHPPRVGANVQVSQDQDPNAVFRSGASELTLAATNNGKQIVVGWNDGEGFGFRPWQPVDPPIGISGYAYSSDAGETFTDGGAPPMGNRIGFGPGILGQSATGNYITRGDPWLAAGGPGNETFYYANMAVWEDNAAIPAGVSVHIGSFKGKDFSWTDSVMVQSPGYPNDFVDKEALAVARHGNQTAVYVTLTNFIETCGFPFFGWGQIELYRSLDGGDTWDQTIIQPDETFVTDPGDPSCGADGVINQGSMPAVAPNGDLYVTWERGWYAPIIGGPELSRATIVVAKSTDQGATFTDPVEVASICSSLLSPPAAYNRTTSNDFPRVAIAQSGPHRGRIYVSFHDCSAASGGAPFGPDTDVYIAYSDDDGATWSTPSPVHAVADGKMQFWPDVSVDTTGNVDVTYYEMEDINLTPDPNDIECSVRIGGPLNDPDLRQSTLTTFSDFYWVQSTDGGDTWHTPVRLTDVSTNWCAATPINSIIPNFGDYNDSASFGNNVFAAWADGRNGGYVDRVPTAFYSHIDGVGKAPR